MQYSIASDLAIAKYPSYTNIGARLFTVLLRNYDSVLVCVCVCVCKCSCHSRFKYDSAKLPSKASDETFSFHAIHSLVYDCTQANTLYRLDLNSLAAYHTTHYASKLRSQIVRSVTADATRRPLLRLITALLAYNIRNDTRFLYTICLTSKHLSYRVSLEFSQIQNT